VLTGAFSFSLARCSYVEELLELDLGFAPVTRTIVEQFLDLGFHNVPEQKVALPVPKAHHVPVQMVHIDAALAVPIAIKNVQGPIAETRLGVGPPADPLEAVEIAVLAAPALGGGTRQLVGGRRGVDAREASRSRGVRARSLLAAAGAAGGRLLQRRIELSFGARLRMRLRRCFGFAAVIARRNRTIAALAPGLAVATVAVAALPGSRHLRGVFGSMSGQRPTAPIDFLLYISSQIIFVAILFVGVDRWDLDGFVVLSLVAAAAVRKLFLVRFLERVAVAIAIAVARLLCSFLPVGTAGLWSVGMSVGFGVRARGRGHILGFVIVGRHIPRRFSSGWYPARGGFGSMRTSHTIVERIGR